MAEKGEIYTLQTRLRIKLATIKGCALLTLLLKALL
jgi:uncharacterized membrane protein